MYHGGTTVSVDERHLTGYQHDHAHAISQTMPTLAETPSYTLSPPSVF
jgi:hypothetical protein